jgi:hypothetical protein
MMPLVSEWSRPLQVRRAADRDRLRKLAHAGETTARSQCGARPTMVALTASPDASRTARAFVPTTTWSLETTLPAWSQMNPVPVRISAHWEPTVTAPRRRRGLPREGLTARRAQRLRWWISHSPRDSRALDRGVVHVPPCRRST